MAEAPDREAAGVRSGNSTLAGRDKGIATWQEEEGEGEKPRSCNTAG
ncbi:hypothetical protein EYF80_057365 [Liparis tanakae]|uniref:Uncharacterized protein n=1 Tax=Liparis tanakae TaxID=230148 RepID=A0A4Z2EUN0_9TELE|nr:hypothetical protein EYF80_057365 [Liparis tanakae]